MNERHLILQELGELASKREAIAAIIRTSAADYGIFLDFWKVNLSIATYLSQLGEVNFAKRSLLHLFERWGEWTHSPRYDSGLRQMLKESLSHHLRELEALPFMKLTSEEHFDLFYHTANCRGPLLKIS